MSHYEVTNSVGSFQSEDMEGDNQQPTATPQQPAANNQQPAANSQKPDTTKVQVPVRQAAKRHKATQKST